MFGIHPTTLLVLAIDTPYPKDGWPAAGMVVVGFIGVIVRDCDTRSVIAYNTVIKNRRGAAVRALPFAQWKEDICVAVMMPDAEGDEEVTTGSLVLAVVYTTRACFSKKSWREVVEKARVRTSEVSSSAMVTLMVGCWGAGGAAALLATIWYSSSSSSLSSANRDADAAAAIIDLLLRVEAMSVKVKRMMMMVMMMKPPI